ncbi:MAG: DUF4270 family protein [Thermoflavifilum aggregans]|nr:DUF4270 family protein [Thermoflavifilum aggregans]
MKSSHGFVFRWICTLALATSGMWYLSSCKNDSSALGSTFFPSHTNVLQIDTLTPLVETVFLDSIPTSGTGVSLVGTYSDTLSGTINAYSYFAIGAPAVKSITSKVVFDSLCLVLKPNRYYLGDTTSAFHLNVYALTRQLDLGTNSAFYNTTVFPFQSTPLASWTGRIYPNRNDSVLIRLPDQMGINWLNAIINNPSTISTDNAFINNYLPGLVIKGWNNQFIVGFAAKDSSTYIRMYYHNQTDAKTPLYNDFQITQTGLQFNHVDVDKSQTPFAGINSQHKLISSALTHHYAILQPLAGTAVRISFPGMDNLKQIGTYSRILSAKLIVKPLRGTYAPGNPLPPLVTLTEVTDYYTIQDSLFNSSGNYQHGDLVQDFAFGNSYYTYDITPYLVNQLSITNFNLRTRLMLIIPRPAFNTTFQRLIVNDQQTRQDPMQVSIQMLIYTIR